MPSLVELPDEVLEQVLSHLLIQPWPVDVPGQRHGVLRVSRRLHRLGRRFLYEDVTLSSLQGFHGFFLVDETDWERTNPGCCVGQGTVATYVHTKRWREDGAASRRRQGDWERVRSLTIDLNFTSSHPHVSTDIFIPYLTDGFGRSVALQKPGSEPLLPHLLHLTERTTAEHEDCALYQAHTLFRFYFYGTFSPRTFRVPCFPYPSRRYFQVAAQRYPLHFLSKTVKLSVTDLFDLVELFPLLPYLPVKLDEEAEAQKRTYVTAISHSLETLVCLNEDFGYHLADEEFAEHFEQTTSYVVKQFPHIRRLHLPKPEAFWPWDPCRAEEPFVKAYRTAVEQLRRHDETKIRELEVVLDQEIYTDGETAGDTVRLNE